MTGKNDCPVEGNEVTVKMSKTGKKYLSISPGSETTDANGNALFTIKAKKLSGRVGVTFRAGSLKKVLIVKVKK